MRTGLFRRCWIRLVLEWNGYCPTHLTQNTQRFNLVSRMYYLRNRCEECCKIGLEKHNQRRAEKTAYIQSLMKEL